jgi:hypothetical protein
MKLSHLAGAAALFGATLAGSAQATTINFSSLSPGTVVSNQFAGVSFAVVGGPGPDGSPVVDLFEGGTPALLNSTTDDYPSNAYLAITFAAPASNVSFGFANFGTPSFDGGGEAAPPLLKAPTVRGESNWAAFDESNTLIGSGFLWELQNFEQVQVGSNVSFLYITNGTDGSDSWIFGISQLNFNGAVPEPGSWAMMILGFGAIGSAMRRRQVALAA